MEQLWIQPLSRSLPFFRGRLSSIVSVSLVAKGQLILFSLRTAAVLGSTFPSLRLLICTQGLKGQPVKWSNTPLLKGQCTVCRARHLVGDHDHCRGIKLSRFINIVSSRSVCQIKRFNLLTSALIPIHWGTGSNFLCTLIQWWSLWSSPTP